MTEAISGVGTRFQRWNADTEEWENLSEVTAINGPDKSRGTIDVTNLNSLDGYREFISAIRDAGQISATMNFTRAGYDMMNNDFEDDDPKTYRILLPDPDETTLVFEGLVTELPMSIQVDSQITMDTVVKISGKVDVQSGSSTVVI